MNILRKLIGYIVISPLYLITCLIDILAVMPIIFFIAYPIQTLVSIYYWSQTGKYDVGFDIRQDYFLVTRFIFHGKQLQKYYNG